MLLCLNFKITAFDNQVKSGLIWGLYFLESTGLLQSSIQRDTHVYNLYNDIGEYTVLGRYRYTVQNHKKRPTVQKNIQNWNEMKLNFI